MKTLKHKRLRACEKCDGKGGKDVKTCTKCKGRKYIEKLVQLGPGMYTQSQQPCSECKGQGEIMKEEDRCSECQGKKVLEKEKTLQVGIEPGVPNEHDYVFTGESDEYVTLVP
jgi:DnaJ family protein A protein 2